MKRSFIVLIPGYWLLLVETDGSQHDVHDRVGVAVGGWPAILEVSAFVLVDLAGNSDRGASVRRSGAEVVDR